MIQNKCSKIPNVTISNDITPLINKILQSIQNSHKVVQLSFSDINFTILTQFFLPAIQKAHSNGADVTLVTSGNDTLKDYLKKYNFIDFLDINKISQQISSQSIVADNTAFIAPFLVPNKMDENSFNQLITINECDSIVKDVSSFVDYYRLSQTQLNSKVILGKYIAQTSANRPVTVKLADNKQNKSNKSDKVSQAFMFHNPQSLLIPARIDTFKVLTALFDEDPSSIDIYTFSPQCYSFSDDQYNIFSGLKSLLMRNKTKVRYLASLVSYQEKRYSCFSSFLAFDNFDIRLYVKIFDGPNYIIAHFDDNKDESFVFSQVLSDNQINNIVSLHFATDDENTSNYLSDNFNLIWSKSIQVSLNTTSQV